MREILRRAQELAPDLGVLDERELTAQHEAAMQHLAGPLDSEENVAEETGIAKNALLRFWVDGALLALQLTKARQLRLDDTFSPVSEDADWCATHAELRRALVAHAALTDASVEALSRDFATRAHAMLAATPHKRLRLPQSVELCLDRDGLMVRPQTATTAAPSPPR